MGTSMRWRISRTGAGGGSRLAAFVRTDVRRSRQAFEVTPLATQKAATLVARPKRAPAHWHCSAHTQVWS